jgi:hypothetical protein
MESNHGDVMRCSCLGNPRTGGVRCPSRFGGCWDFYDIFGIYPHEKWNNQQESVTRVANWLKKVEKEEKSQVAPLFFIIYL